MFETIGQRIAFVIDKCDLKKVQFADKIGVHQTYVSQMVADKKIPSDRVIKDICEAFNVSEHWLRTGEGEMFLPKPESSLPAELTDDPMIRAILEAYIDLDPQARQTFRKFFADVVARYKSESEPKPAAVPAPEFRTRKIPLIQGTDEAELQMHYQSRMEQRELDLSDLTQLPTAEDGTPINIEVLK